jgi:hypothetical protein
MYLKMTSTTKKIVIWIIVILFLIISGLAFVPYLIAPSSAPVIPEDDQPINLEEYITSEDTDIVVPSNEDINVHNPEENDVQIIVTERENQDEMDQTIEIPLENGEIDTPTLGDFSDSLQLSS